MNDHPGIEVTTDSLRKIILLSQGLYESYGGNASTNRPDLLSVIEHLGYIQIDTISVVERAHHHTLWNRVSGYQPADIQQLVAEKYVFEYWSHAAAYLPMKDYRFSLPRKQAILAGEKHWFEKSKKLTAAILSRIDSEGPLMAKDFEQPAAKQSGWWDWKPAKKALEQLFMEGRLMVVRRQGFQKVYDLTERVLPSGVDTRLPGRKEYLEFLITSYLRANGVARVEHFGYLLKGMKADLKKGATAMLAEGKLVTLRACGLDYLALPGTSAKLSQKIKGNKVFILSPFDNLLIQRQRFKEIFNFDYSLECYLPKQKRQYGYFCLPLLWGRQFAGRMDVKIDRKSGLLTVRKLHLETRQMESFLRALKPALKSYLNFNQGQELVLEQLVSHKVSLSSSRLKRMKQFLIQ